MLILVLGKIFIKVCHKVQYLVLFNIFLNDIFNFVEESILYNYADDNTLSYSDTDLNKVVDILEKES